MIISHKRDKRIIQKRTINNKKRIENSFIKVVLIRKYREFLINVLYFSLVFVSLVEA